MKTTLRLALAGVLACFVVAACGEGQGPPTLPSPAPAAAAAPAPSPEPPPPPPPAAPGSRLPFVSNFDSGSFGEWDGFRNTTGAELVREGALSGFALRTPLVAGTTSDNYGDFYFGDHVEVKGPKIEELWLRVASKFEAGYRWPNRGHKIAILNLTDGAVHERRYQVILAVLPDGQYFLERSDIAASSFTGYRQRVGAPASVRFGEWDHLEVHVRLNTPGVHDGLLRLWVNGDLKIDESSVNIRGNSSFGLNKLILSTYATQASPVNGVQWHDEMHLSQTPFGVAGF